MFCPTTAACSLTVQFCVQQQLPVALLCNDVSNNNYLLYNVVKNNSYLQCNAVSNNSCL